MSPSSHTQHMPDKPKLLMSICSAQAVMRLPAAMTALRFCQPVNRQQLGAQAARWAQAGILSHMSSSTAPADCNLYVVPPLSVVPKLPWAIAIWWWHARWVRTRWRRHAWGECAWRWGHAWGECSMGMHARGRWHARGVCARWWWHAWRVGTRRRGHAWREASVGSGGWGSRVGPRGGHAVGLAWGWCVGRGVGSLGRGGWHGASRCKA
mmetsp:Transcript_26423/g.57641  ORF Transcript_26423/g.57641 Transcript_26423/m.57641 type:complete len:209 (+) Transcript_26423:594-1220(+)